jgi:hypothetical protein
MTPHHREDESLEETQVKTDRRMSPFRIFAVIIALLMILAGIVWFGQLVGFVAAVLPAGPNFLEGWLWGMVGVVGVIVLVMLLWRVGNRA